MDLKKEKESNTKEYFSSSSCTDVYFTTVLVDMFGTHQKIIIKII